MSENVEPRREERPRFLVAPKPVIVAMVLVFLVFTCGIAYVVTYSLQKLTIKDEGTVKWNIISKADWLARPTTEAVTNLTLPVHRVIISHTVFRPCSVQKECVERVREVQDFHMVTRGWSDIGYNFLIGGDGRAYEGRGWNLQGAHTKYYNADSVGIAFLGNFNDVKPPQRQLSAAQSLIEEGVRLKKIADNYRLYGACQLRDTESPGSALYRIIQKWPHWTDQVQ